MKTKAFITVILLSFLATASAQKGIEDGSKYGHGEDSVRCISNLSLFIEYAKQKNYKDALGPWTITYNECPASSLFIYHYGTDIIEWQMKNAQSEEEKEQYIGELLALYDNRIKYFGDHIRYPEAYLLAKKTMEYFKYYGKTLEGQKETVKQLDAAIGKLMKKFSASTARTLIGSIDLYMSLNFALYSRDEINGETLITNYEKSQEQLASLQKATSNYDSDINPIKERMENSFATSGAADCETLILMYADKVESGKTDKDLLEKTLDLFQKTGCTESELFYAASEYLHAIEPSSSSAFGIARMYLNPNKLDIDRALDFYNQALELEEDNDRKADYLHQMALIIFTKKKDYVKARSLAQKAISFRPNWGAPYILIGQMYAVSAQNQELGGKDIENQAGFWAAVDKFAKAKQVDPSSATEADQQIRIYSNYFPSKEDIFFQEGFELEKPFRVGGWINETTICRPKE